MNGSRRHGLDRLRGELRLNEPMRRHTSWRLGGPADRYYRPADLADLQAFLRQLPAGEALTWVGLGSNMLVRDGGIRGTVIDISRALRGLQVDGRRVRAEAGGSCSKLARFTVARGLAGAEFLIGIPGTLGGALAMNAGAFGGETWSLVRRARMIDRQGVVQEYPRADFEIGYRRVRSPAAGWFVDAELELALDADGQGMARISELLRARARSQPIGTPSCGSVFRNPPGEAAAKLIDRCGLKGAREGGAHVSTKHANFILAEAPVAAADVETLIGRVQCKVREHSGVELNPEVLIIGEPIPGVGAVKA